MKSIAYERLPLLLHRSKRAARITRNFATSFECYRAGQFQQTPTCLLKVLPRIGYPQAMRRAVLTLLIGLMLSLSAGANALTFGKDGKQEMPDLIPDNQTPEQFLEAVDSNNKLLRINPMGSHVQMKVDYGQEWNRCSLVSHNIYLLLDKCQPAREAQETLLQARKAEVLKSFKCGFEGYQRYLKNKGAKPFSYEVSVANCSDERTQFTLDEYARLETIIQEGGSEIVDSELKPKPLEPEAELAAPKVQDKQQEQNISSDSEVPLITILSQSSNGPQGNIKGTCNR